MINSSILEKNFAIIVFTLIILFQLAISFQGFDLCDEGMSLTFYQQFFNEPKSVEYNFVYWLSGLVGGIWYIIYPDGGIFSFRILAIITNTLTFLVSYKILSYYMDKKLALIGLAMVMIANDYGFLVFYHNPLTGLIAVTSIYLLLNGLVDNNNRYILLTGLLVAVNVSARLPNLTFFIIVTTIPFYYWIKGASITKSLRKISIFFIGAFLGFGLIFLVLGVLGQLDIMTSSLAGITTSGDTDTSNHNLFFLIEQYVLSYRIVIKVLLMLVISAILAIPIFRLIPNSKVWKYLIVASAIILISCKYGFKNVEFLYALSFVGCFGIIVTKNNPEMKLLALCGLIAAIFLPMGSDGGIRNSGYMAIWISTPLFLHFVCNLSNLEENFHIKIPQINSLNISSLKYIAVIIVTGFFIRKIYNISNEAYFDYGSRFNKVYKIENKFADNILTTKKRARITNDLLAELEKYVKPNDYLLAYDKLPMIHFLTETKPYMFIPWVWVYDQNSFVQKIREAEENREQLPVVLQQKFETIRYFSEPMNDYMSENKVNTYRYNKDRVIEMNDFLKRNNYEIAWSNDYFNIYLPKYN